MKILCVYYDEEADFLASDPEEALVGHKVECVTTFEEAKVFLQRNNQKPIDVVLADVQVPIDEDSEEFMPTALLVPYFAYAKVKGFGVFVPRHFESVGTVPQGNEFAMVSSRECITPADKRDWNKLLTLVLRQMH